MRNVEAQGKIMIKNTAGLLLVFIIFNLGGCGSGSLNKAFMREGATISHIRTVAVLPFENLGGTAGAAQRTREITMTQILASGLFDVVDKGRVDSMLRDEAIDPSAPINEASLRRLGQRLGAQGFILASVEQGTESRGSTSFPKVAMTMRLLDAETGTLVWQATGEETGYSLMDRLFGLTPKNAFLVTLDLLDKLLATIRG
jgi:TolB-like protein